MKEKQTKKEDGFFKSILKEIRDSVIVELIWNIIIFIPRMIIRMWKSFD
ncbi:hypothetical protein [Psychrobacillus sp. OK032]|nr:hypothetical protein [Psychrobacillus sp. OK032]SES18898.1 hypothetical protein SAMN05518872_105213 [Psychrobacillus sp. OK032]